MISIITGLLGNKWIVGGAAVIGLLLAVWVTAYTKGYNAANAKQWQQQVIALKKAADQKDAIIAADAKQADADAADKAKLEAQLTEITNEANQTPSACKFSDIELRSLCSLAGAGRQCGIPLSASPIKPAS